MTEDKRKEQIELLKGMVQGAKDDPKGAAIFFRDLAKIAVKEAPGKIQGRIQEFRGR